MLLTCSIVVHLKEVSQCHAVEAVRKGMERPGPDHTEAELGTYPLLILQLLLWLSGIKLLKRWGELVESSENKIKQKANNKIKQKKKLPNKK